jgi:hypothetical protein
MRKTISKGRTYKSAINKCIFEHNFFIISIIMFVGVFVFYSLMLGDRLESEMFTSVDTGARFNVAGQQINGNFGSNTASEKPRRMQLGLKFAF